MRSLVRHLVDDEQYAVLTYRIALLHPDVRNLTAYLRANLHGLIPPYGSRITTAERAAAQRYRIRPVSRSSLLPPVAASVAGEKAQSTSGKNHFCFISVIHTESFFGHNITKKSTGRENSVDERWNCGGKRRGQFLYATSGISIFANKLFIMNGI